MSETVIEDRLKMYCVFAMESVAKMKGSRGKLASSAGHAYLHAYWDAAVRFPRPAESYTVGLAYKVTLKVDTVHELRVLEEAYRETHGVSLVVDAGLTVFDGPTAVCLGIFPIYDS